MPFAIGIQCPKTVENTGGLFRSAQNFGASLLFTIGKRYHNDPTDTQKAWRHIPLCNFLNWKDCADHLPMDWIPVVVEITDDATPINTFIHPKRAIYILGPEDGQVSATIQEHVTRKIFIPTKRCLNVAVTGAIVMYDRMIKEQAFFQTQSNKTAKIFLDKEIKSEV